MELGKLKISFLILFKRVCIVEHYILPKTQHLLVNKKFFIFVYSNYVAYDRKN